MNKSKLIIVLFLLVSLGMSGCGSSGTSQETENLKKEVEALKKQKEDEKLAKEKEDLQKQKDALTKEKQQLASEKKKAEEKQKAEVKKEEGEKPPVGRQSGKVSVTPSTTFYADLNLATKIGEINEGETVEILLQIQQRKDSRETMCKVNYKGKIGYLLCNVLDYE